MDLGIAIIAMGVIAVVTLFGTSRYLGRTTPPRPAEPNSMESMQRSEKSRTPAIVLAIAIFVAVVLLFATKDRLFWANIFPGSAAIIWSNLTVIALAVAAGAAYRLPNRPSWRRYLSAGALSLLSLATLLQPVLQPILRPIEGANHWDDDEVCIQSEAMTCSAAAGATLLNFHGISVTEADMVDFSLTDARGTPSLGLWRGLCKATVDTPVKPRIVHRSVEELLTSGPWPLVLVVGLPTHGADPIYVKKYGWDPGFRHSVVLFGRKEEGLVDIGDPAIGRETWSDDDLRVLWRGEAIELSKRN